MAGAPFCIIKLSDFFRGTDFSFLGIVGVEKFSTLKVVKNLPKPEIVKNAKSEQDPNIIFQNGPPAVSLVDNHKPQNCIFAKIMNFLCNKGLG